MKVQLFLLLCPLLFSSFSGCTIRSGTTTSNMSNQWVYKFHYLNGNVQGFFKAEKDDAQLIYSSNLENGSVDFQLYDSKGCLLLAFPANNNTNTIKDVFVKGERYKIIAIAKEAKGQFEFTME